MAGAEKTVERLRQFLRELSPGACSLLIGELERSVLRGEEVAGADVVLQELRRILREQRDGALSIDDSAQLLFKPLEPFLVDDRGDHKHPGRVARSSLEALWNWVRRDLLPNDANVMASDVSQAMLDGDQAKTERLARIFQDRVAAAIEANFTAAAEDGKIRRRILQQIGTPRAAEELAALKCALKERDVLASRRGPYGGPMQRREFIILLGGTAVAWPLTARAQQPAMPVIGILRSASAATSMHLVAAFRKGLAEAGFVEGKDVAIELRVADDDFGRLPALATDLVRRGVAVIVGNIFAVPAIRAATTTIPVVFVGGDDPVRTGVVTSLNKPGANVTGITSFGYALTAKRLQLLHELAPKSAAIAVLLDPNAAEFAPEEPEAKKAARALGRDILVVQAGTAPDLEAAFATIARARPGALLVGGGAFLAGSQRQQLVAFAARQALIAIYSLRETVVAGGLMSYGTSLPDAYRHAGVYAARILKGEKPADLPVMQPTKFELVINLKTAKTLGLAIPSGRRDH